MGGRVHGSAGAYRGGAGGRLHSTSPCGRFASCFFDETATAFANVGRTRGPGGRLTFVCWQNLADNPARLRGNNPLAVYCPPVPPPARGRADLHIGGPRIYRRLVGGSGLVRRRTNALSSNRDPRARSPSGRRRLFAISGVAGNRLAGPRAALERHLAPLRRNDGRYEARWLYRCSTARN